VNYVIAAWLACAAILVVYALRTVHRERSLRRSLTPKAVPPTTGVASDGGSKWT
jgi:hypothetical protein